MDIILEELAAGLPGTRQVVRVFLRLMVAISLGAIIGIQRERTGKPVGLRTHMLVALGAALFVLAPGEAGMNLGDLSRVIQGLATGIGFLGAGAILKSYGENEVHGLTTAAGIWLTAAVGVTAGLGRWGLALLSAVLAWIILGVLAKFELGAKKSAIAKNDLV